MNHEYQKCIASYIIFGVRRSVRNQDLINQLAICVGKGRQLLVHKNPKSVKISAIIGFDHWQ